MGRRVNKLGTEGLRPQRATLDRLTHRMSRPLGNTQAMGLLVGDSAHPLHISQGCDCFPHSAPRKSPLMPWGL